MRDKSNFHLKLEVFTCDPFVCTIQRSIGNQTINIQRVQIGSKLAALLITFLCQQFDPDKDRQNVGPDLDPNHGAPERIFL